MPEIEPSKEALLAFRHSSHDGPVAMLNLLRFLPQGGEASYRRYLAALTPLARRFGAEVLCLGSGISPLLSDEHWDMLLLVRYPSKEAFFRTVTHPDYEKVRHLRTEALDKAVLYPFAPQEASG